MMALILTLAMIGCVVYYAIVAVCVILYLMQVFGIADLPLPRAK